MRWVLLLPLYRWRNGSTEGPSNLPKVTQLVNAELGIKLRVHVLTSMQFHLSKTSSKTLRFVPDMMQTAQMCWECNWPFTCITTLMLTIILFEYYYSNLQMGDLRHREVMSKVRE